MRINNGIDGPGAQLGGLLFKLLGWLGVLFLVLPLLVVFPIAFSESNFLGYPTTGFSLKWFASLMASYPWMLALKNSIIVAVSVTMIATTLGTLAAYGLNTVEFRLKPLLVGIIVTPALVPVVIVALASYFALARIGLIGSLLAVVIAHTVIAVPMVFLTVSATLKGFDLNLVRAGASLGAAPVTAFLKITLPLISPGVLAGAVFAFVTSFDELIIALFLTGPGQITIPRQLYSDLRDQLTPSIVALAILLSAVSALMIWVVNLLQKPGNRTPLTDCD
ncbi:ABC transporter permease [Aminobacter aminovorans]|nr:ABC transporter permease [Aminobacter aminovorans]